MLRSLVALGRSRTAVRELRTARGGRLNKPSSGPAAVPMVARRGDDADPNLPADTANQRQQPQLPFGPIHDGQHSVGSTLTSYALAGVGVALGVSFVGAVLGAL